MPVDDIEQTGTAKSENYSKVKKSSSRSPRDHKHRRRSGSEHRKRSSESRRESERRRNTAPTASSRIEGEEEEWNKKVWKIIMTVLGSLTVAGVVIGLSVHFLGGASSDLPGVSNDETYSSTTTVSYATLSTTPSPYNDSVWDGIRGDCGVPRIKPDLKRGRIVGGDEAVANSWPWQISLVKYISFGDGYASLKHICGGTLIGPNTVISATHCFLNRDRTQTTTKADSYRVIVGGHDKSKLTKGAKMSKIAQIIHHPLNNLATFSKQRVAPVNDISLLKLVNSYNPSRSSPVVAFACLPKPKVFPPVGKRCWSSGWGRTMYTGSDDVLKQLPQPIVSQQLCTKFYSNMISYDKHLCALESAAGTCQGDSGGPLVCQGSDMKWSLYGATSFGPVPCATAPGVFSSVANYIEWLCCHMDDTGPCAKIACKLP